MHARGATAPATVSGASAASVETTSRRKIGTTIWADATDTHGERRARRDRHSRRRPTAQATRAAESPKPKTAFRACGHNRDADDAGGDRKGLRTACIGERRGTGRQSDGERLRSTRPAGRRDRHRVGTGLAARSITMFAVSDVLLPTTTLLTVTPPLSTVTVVAPTTKLVPVSVTAIVSPRSS